MKTVTLEEWAVGLSESQPHPEVSLCRRMHDPSDPFFVHHPEMLQFPFCYILAVNIRGKFAFMELLWDDIARALLSRVEDDEAQDAFLDSLIDQLSNPKIRLHPKMIAAPGQEQETDASDDASDDEEDSPGQLFGIGGEGIVVHSLESWLYGREPEPVEVLF